MGQDERAVGVHHPETAKEDVPGDQVGDPGNDARHEDGERQPLLAPARDRVGGGEADGEPERRATGRDDQAVPGVEQERILREDLTIAGHRDAEAHERGRVGGRLDLGLQGERDHPVEDEHGREHEQDGEPVEAGGGRDSTGAPASHHEAVLRTLIKIIDAPSTTAKSATAIDEA